MSAFAALNLLSHASKAVELGLLVSFVLGPYALGLGVYQFPARQSICFAMRLASTLLRRWP